jgi:hypothetical protein
MDSLPPEMLTLIGSYNKQDFKVFIAFDRNFLKAKWEIKFHIFAKNHNSAVLALFKSMNNSKYYGKLSTNEYIHATLVECGALEPLPGHYTDFSQIIKRLDTNDLFKMAEQNKEKLFDAFDNHFKNTFKIIEVETCVDGSFAIEV